MALHSCKVFDKKYIVCLCNKLLKLETLLLTRCQTMMRLLTIVRDDNAIKCQPISFRMNYVQIKRYKTAFDVSNSMTYSTYKTSASQCKMCVTILPCLAGNDVNIHTAHSWKSSLSTSELVDTSSALCLFRFMTSR